MSSDHLLVVTTLPSTEKAAEIARVLVTEGLVACVNVAPAVRSIYLWKGEVCDEPEVLCLLKTRRDGFEALRARLAALHPYEVPEILALEVAAGHAPYLAWVDACCRPGE